MSRFASPYNPSFAAGEWAEELYGRSDLDRYVSAMRRCENMVVRRTGAVARRPGTNYAGAVKDSTKVGRLIPFRRSSTTNLIIEAGDLYFRFWKNHAPVLSGGSPVEVVTPYAATDLAALAWYQSADTLYLVHPSYEPRKLVRTSDTSWALSTCSSTKGGPYRTENTSTTTLTASAVTGVGITITASSATFNASHVGSIWMMRQKDWSALKKWQGNQAYGAGDKIRSGFRVYSTAAGGTSGLNGPTHTEGTENDGAPGVAWTFLYSGFGLFKITGYTSATQVTADVLSIPGSTQLPTDATAGTTKWREPRFSGYRGWPISVGIYQERLVYFMGQTVSLSVSSDFENSNPFSEAGEIEADTAFDLTISDDLADSIIWGRPFAGLLLVGTAGSEWSIGPQNSTTSFGPTNFDLQQHTFVGTQYPSKPVRVDNGTTFFVDRSGGRLHLVKANEDATSLSTLASEDMSIYGYHLTLSGIEEIEYTDEPDSIVWCRLATGGLAGLTYEKKQNVIAWHRHTIAGQDAFVESLAAIPDPTNSWDELWLLVRRTVNGATVRYLEYFGAPEETVAVQNDVCFLDCMTRQTAYPAIDTWTVGHLANETVMVLADGLVAFDQVLSGTTLTLARKALTVFAGYPATARATPMPPEAGSAIGHSQGKKQRIVHAYPRLIRTNYLKITDGRETYLDDVNFPVNTEAEAYPIPFYTGIMRVNVPGNNEDEQQALVTFVADACLPLTIASVGWNEVIGER